MARNCAPENLAPQLLDSGFAFRAPRNDVPIKTPPEESSHEPDLLLLLASLGGAVGGVCGADRDLRQGRRRGHQFRPRDPDPHRHRAGRAVADPLCDRQARPSRADSGQNMAVPAALRPRHRRLLAVLFPRAQARPGHTGGADRQAERGAGGAVRRALPGRAALAQRLARHRADLGRGDFGCGETGIIGVPFAFVPAKACFRRDDRVTPSLRRPPCSSRRGRRRGSICRRRGCRPHRSLP
jgi:hypothetical protein